MPISIESFSAYHSQKQLLSEYIQIGSAAFSLLMRNVDVENGAQLLGGFVDACSTKHWGRGKAFGVSNVRQIQSDFANFGVVHQTSAFDQFSTSLVIEIAKFSSKARSKYEVLSHDHALLIKSPQSRWVMSPCCNELTDKIGKLSVRLETLKQRLDWVPSSKLVAIFPIFHLARKIRNSITHRDSMIGADLAEFRASSDVTAAFESFRTEYAQRDLPVFPDFHRGDRIKLEPVHAIFFGAVLNEIAKELNLHAVSLLEFEEFIDMAFYYSCMPDNHPFRTIRHKSAEARVKHFLSNRYWRQRSKISTAAVIARLASQKLESSAQSTQAPSLWTVALQRHRELTES